MRDREYWAARALQREREAYLEGSRLTAKLFKEYERAATAIREAISAFYGKYAGGHGLTYEQAVRALTRREAQAWKGMLGEYVAQLNAQTAPRIKAAMTAQLDALSGNASISRLEALEGQIDLILNDLHDRGVAQLKAEFGDLFQEGYYHKMYDLQSRAGWLAEFAKVDPELVESAVNYPWSGAMFSDRLWKNKEALVFSLREAVTQGLIQGKGLSAVSKELSGRLGQSYKAAERVVRTETNHLHNEADKAAYRAAGVEEYEFMATLDSRTCEVCGALDGKHFKLSEAKPGVNFPPMHPNDRCTTVEYDPEDATDWAKSGKQMPERMTYEEWARERGVDQEGDLGDMARRAVKSVTNRAKVVGFDGLPKEYREQFRAGLAKAAPEAKEVLCRAYRETDYIVSQGKRSYYRRSGDVVEIGREAPPSTLAHELFHRLDKGHSISEALSAGLIQDYVSLNVASGGNIKAYLTRNYAQAFSHTSLRGDPIFSEAYRGIADILNGLSGGKINYGYGHSTDYWKGSGALEAEAWAQFGRILFDNDPMVVKMLYELFPNFSENAMLTLKGLI